MENKVFNAGFTDGGNSQDAEASSVPKFTNNSGGNSNTPPGLASSCSNRTLPQNENIQSDTVQAGTAINACSLPTSDYNYNTMGDSPLDSELTYCRLCKNNGLLPHIYTSHRLYDSNRKVQCPILRGSKCSLCKATGDNSHTTKFCPIYRQMKAASLNELLTAPKDSK